MEEPHRSLTTETDSTLQCVKYWRRRAIIVDGSNKTCRLLNLYYLLWIKRVDARNFDIDNNENSYHRKK